MAEQFLEEQFVEEQVLVEQLAEEQAVKEQVLKKQRLKGQVSEEQAVKEAYGTQSERTRGARLGSARHAAVAAGLRHAVGADQRRRPSARSRSGPEAPASVQLGTRPRFSSARGSQQLSVEQPLERPVKVARTVTIPSSCPGTPSDSAGSAVRPTAIAGYPVAGPGPGRIPLPGGSLGLSLLSTTKT